MEFSFDARVVVVMDHKNGSQNSSHISTNFNLYPSSNLDKKMYINSENLPTKEGSKVLTTTLVQGLIGNIHMAHASGFKDSAQHLREIITQLEAGFVAVAQITKSEFK